MLYFGVSPACRVCYRIDRLHVGSRFILGVFLCKTGHFVIADSWESKWVYSEHPGKEFGKFKLTSGKFYSNTDDDKGTFLIHNFLSPNDIALVNYCLWSPKC